MKLLKNFTMLFLLFIIAFAACACSNSEKASPITGKISGTPKILPIVEEYFLNYTKHDWEQVYNCLDIPDGTFTTREQFISLMEENTQLNKITEIDDYTITESEHESAYEKRYRVEYLEANSPNTNIMDIVLIKHTNDEYKVSAEEFIAKNILITVPADSVIYIDNIVVDTKPLSATTYEDEYLIDYIFAGQHDILIESSYLESVTDTFLAKTDAAFTFSDFQITNASLNEMCSILVSASNKIYSAAIEKHSFDTIQHLYSPDCDIDKIEAMYTELCDEVDYSDGSGLKEAKFSNAQLRSDYSMDYSNYVFNFVGLINSDVTRVYYNKKNNEVKYQKPALQLPGKVEADFRYTNGKWQIDTLYIFPSGTPENLD